MNFHGKSGTEILSIVYARFQPKPLWNADALQGLESQHPVRMYCPGCMNYATITKRTDVESKLQTPWYCSHCKTWHTRPLFLRSSGKMTGKNEQEKRDNVNQILEGIQAGAVLAAAEDGDPLLRHWAHWVYADFDRDSDLSAIFAYVIDAYSEDKGKQSLSEAHRKIQLALKVLENFREQIRNTGKLYTNRDLANMLHVNESQLQPGRKWGDVVKEVEDILRLIDKTLSDAVEDVCFGLPASA